VPIRFRYLVEDLGGMFVKVGQLISMRPDLVNLEWVHATEQLLDRVTPFPGEQAISIIEAELGQPIDALFAVFDPVPAAAASFAQVHRAVLPDGRNVAVKVLRPGLEAAVRSDLRLIRIIVRTIELTGLARRVRLSEMLEDLARWTYEELDLRKEGAYATALRESEVKIPGEHIPLIHWSHTGRCVLTMEYLTGVWLSDFKEAVDTGDFARLRAWAEEGLDRREVAATLFETMMRQVFERGTFHGDPHAGNLVMLERGVVGYVDFGITGQVDQRFQDIQMAVLLSLSQSDFDSFFRSVIKFFYPLPSSANIMAMRREMIDAARDWTNARYNRKAELADRGTAVLLGGVLSVARRYEVAVSSIALRYFRAVMAIEALILTLDPDFPYRARLKRSLAGIAVRRVRARNTPDGLAMAMIGALDLMQTMPTRLIRSFTDLDESRRSIVKTVNGTLTGFATLFRWSSRLLGILAILTPINLFTKWIPIGTGLTWAAALGLAITAVVLAGVAQRLYMSALPSAD
jgi:ubiquinone biosynthesis protein